MMKTSLLLFLLISFSSTVKASISSCSNVIETCSDRGNRDIMFLIDGSNSMAKADFYGDMLTFTEQIYCAFNSEDVNYAGMIVFNGDVQVVIPLEERTQAQWITAVEAVRADPTYCCSCCTPTADAYEMAKNEIAKYGRNPSVEKVYQMVFTISDGVPYNNQNGPFAYPRVSLAKYLYIDVPQEAKDLKSIGVRVVFIGVPTGAGEPPNVDYFAGIPDPALTPTGSPSMTQCVVRDKQTTCGVITSDRFPIVSLPVNENLFSTTTWDVTSMIQQTIKGICQLPTTQAPTKTNSPTKQPSSKSPSGRPSNRPTKKPLTSKPTEMPTKQPIKAPTEKPSNIPTKKPTMRPTKKPSHHPTNKPTNYPTPEPTKQPTNFPSPRPSMRPTTRNPTRRPTFRPTLQPTYQPTLRPIKKPTTRSPTQKPTKRPSNHPTISPTKPNLDHLDLYFLLDASGSMLSENDICASVIVKDANVALNPVPASKCWMLFLTFVLELAQQVALLGLYGPMGWEGDKNDLSRGLRVSVVGFACNVEQTIPVVYDIANLVNEYDKLYDLVNEAGQTIFPHGGTCPSSAIDLVVSQVQNVNRLVRPFQAAILLTDGIFYDLPYPELAEQGLFHFNVQTFAVGIAIASAGIGPQMEKDQRTQLGLFVDHVPGRFYNLGSTGFSVLESLATEFAHNLPTQFYKIGIMEYTPWCGYTSSTPCLTANGVADTCHWFQVDHTCRASNFCSQFFGAHCSASPYCSWTGFTTHTCKTLGETNGGTLVPVSGTPHPTFQPYKETPMPTNQPENGKTHKTAHPTPTTVISSTCAWSSDIINNSGQEFTPLDPCSSKTTFYGCNFKNICCWDFSSGACAPPDGCPECVGFFDSPSCLAEASCCTWNSAEGNCQRLCLGTETSVCPTGD